MIKTYGKTLEVVVGSGGIRVYPIGVPSAPLGTIVVELDVLRDEIKVRWETDSPGQLTPDQMRDVLALLEATENEWARSKDPGQGESL